MFSPPRRQNHSAIPIVRVRSASRSGTPGLEILIIVAESPEIGPVKSAPCDTLQGLAKREIHDPHFAERRALAFCVFGMTSGGGFAPNVRAANEWMRWTVAKGRMVVWNPLTWQ